MQKSARGDRRADAKDSAVAGSAGVGGVGGSGGWRRSVGPPGGGELDGDLLHGPPEVRTQVHLMADGGGEGHGDDGEAVAPRPEDGARHPVQPGVDGVVGELEAEGGISGAGGARPEEESRVDQPHRALLMAMPEVFLDGGAEEDRGVAQLTPRGGHPEVRGDGLPETRGHGHDAVEAVAEVLVNEFEDLRQRLGVLGDEDHVRRPEGHRRLGGDEAGALVVELDNADAVLLGPRLILRRR